MAFLLSRRNVLRTMDLTGKYSSLFDQIANRIRDLPCTTNFWERVSS